MTGQMSCQYTTYIAATPAEVWQAITDPELSAGWWAHRNVSDWLPGRLGNTGGWTARDYSVSAERGWPSKATR